MSGKLCLVGLVWLLGEPRLLLQQSRPIHTEKGLKGRIVVEKTTESMYVELKESKRYGIAARYTYHRLLLNDTAFGVQARELDYHVFDDVMCLFAGRPLETIATFGAVRAYDVRQEPRSYYHREGPIGAIYNELRTRKNGADAKAPVAVLGLTAGEQACYAIKGQKMTFYEADPALTRIVAATDKYFSYVADARKRGAEVAVRVGDRRAKLKEDKDAKYALIVVDAAESFPYPTDIFTKEAVREYFDRLTDDGIVALHTSNKYLFLEPMFAQIAAELKLEARVWNDAPERTRMGRYACSWLVLARNAKALGSLDAPEQTKTFRPIEVFEGVPAWTDASADVTILSNSPTMQKFRRLLGLPTPLDFTKRK